MKEAKSKFLPLPYFKGKPNDMTDMSKEIIEDGKYVELTYKVIDQNSGSVLTMIEYPLGYVHGTNEILAPAVMAE